MSPTSYTQGSQDHSFLLSVILSFRNEESVIPELIKRLTDTLEPLHLRYELIFVDDDSTDGSFALLCKYHEQDKNIKIIKMSRRFGNAHCVIAGFSEAKGDATVYLDVDLQDPPEVIPLLLEQWRLGAEGVHTTRTIRKGESPAKMWLTRQAYRAINFVSDIHLPANTGDFKLLSRRAVQELMKLHEYDPFLRGLVHWIGFKQATVLYEREARFAGETHYSLFKSLNPAREFIRGFTSFSSLPLYFALILGFVVSLGAFIYLSIIVITRVFFGMHLPGWPALMVTMLFLGGTILFTIGVLGIYVGRIYKEMKSRPRFITERKVGFDDDPTLAKGS